MSITNNNESNVADIVIQTLTNWLEHGGGQSAEISTHALQQAVASAGGNPAALQTMDLGPLYAQACDNAGYPPPAHPPATVDRIVQEVKHVQEINEYHTEINNIDNSQNVNNNLDLSGTEFNGEGPVDINFDPTSATGGSVAGGAGSTVTGATFGGVASSGFGDVTASTGSGSAASGEATLADNGSTAVGGEGVLAEPGAIVAQGGSSVATDGSLSFTGPNLGNANTGAGAVQLGGTFTQTAGSGGAATSTGGAGTGAAGGSGGDGGGGFIGGDGGGGGGGGAGTGGDGGPATGGAGGSNGGPFSGPITINTGGGPQQVDQSNHEGGGPSVTQFGAGVGDQVAQSPGAVTAHGPITQTNSQLGGVGNNNANATENDYHTQNHPSPDYQQEPPQESKLLDTHPHSGGDDHHIDIHQHSDPSHEVIHPL